MKFVFKKVPREQVANSCFMYATYRLHLFLMSQASSKMEVLTARLNTIYIPTWNNRNGDFGEISPFLFLVRKKILLRFCTLTNKNVYLYT